MVCLIWNKIQKQEKRRSKEERDIINAMKPFARFSDKKEHERRVSNLLKEYQLRVLIGQLKYFRSLGLTNLDQIESHIEEKKKEGKFDDTKDGATINFIKKQKTYIGTETSTSGRSRRAPNASVEIANASGFSQLTEEEKDLVIKIGLMPDQYNIMKNLFIKEFESNGEVKESFINKAAQNVDEKSNAQQAWVVFNFLVGNESIKRAPHEPMEE